MMEFIWNLKLLCIILFFFCFLLFFLISFPLTFKVEVSDIACCPFHFLQRTLICPSVPPEFSSCTISNPNSCLDSEIIPSSSEGFHEFTPKDSFTLRVLNAPSIFPYLAWTIFLHILLCSWANLHNCLPSKAQFKTFNLFIPKPPCFLSLQMILQLIICTFLPSGYLIGNLFEFFLFFNLIFTLLGIELRDMQSIGRLDRVLFKRVNLPSLDTYCFFQEVSLFWNKRFSVLASSILELIFTLWRGGL